LSVDERRAVAGDSRGALSRAGHHADRRDRHRASRRSKRRVGRARRNRFGSRRSEEHTSELQSRGHLVCRLLLEKKKKKNKIDKIYEKNKIKLKTDKTTDIRSTL